MSEARHRRHTRTASRERRREVEQRLAEFKAARGQRRVLRDASACFDFDERPSQQLRAALEDLGAGFALFGLYLSTRVDLFPIKDCRELAAISDQAAETPFRVVRELIIRELGCPPEIAFPIFEEEPFESRLLFQSHHAWLMSGMAVTVKFIHPELEEQLRVDVELLTLLQEALAVWPRLSFESALSDFRFTLQQQLDLTYEAEALQTLALDASDDSLLRIPWVHGQLSTSKVLVRERLDGVKLQELISTLNWTTEKKGAPSASRAGTRPNHSDLARRLWLVWLQQALMGRMFPFDLNLADITILPNERIAFIGGLGANLPKGAQLNIRDYLTAAGAEDPDRACTLLLKETIRNGRHDEEELRLKFRQVTPFRDGSWEGDVHSLTEPIFVHWRLASERGYLPQLHLLRFYRGFYQIAVAAQRLSPERDSLLDAFRQMRLLETMTQLRELMSLRQLDENFDLYASVFLDLPRKFNEALTLMAEGNARLKLQVSERAATRRNAQNSLVVIAVLLMMLAVVALLSQYLAASTRFGVWVEGVGAFLFIVLGALLLRAVGRT